MNLLKPFLALRTIAGLAALNKEVDERAGKSLKGVELERHRAQVRVLRCFLLTLAVLVAIVTSLVAGAPERIVDALYWLFIGLGIATGVLWAVADQKK